MKIALALIFVIVAWNVNAQAAAAQKGDSIITCSCLDKDIIFNFSKTDIRSVRKFHAQKLYFLSISFNDSSYIQVHCGEDAKIPYFRKPVYIVSDSSKIRNYQMRQGMIRRKRLRWREDIYVRDMINIAYLNVPEKNKTSFDHILDNCKDILKSK